jgi:aminoglycoside phosphotransferase family enzyme/predicted kinase
VELLARSEAVTHPSIEPLPDGLVASLSRPGSHSDDPSAGRGVEWIQTHISHVFRTAERVAKLRKAVALRFLDFSTRALRNADCLNEVRLNRRLAPDVYLGVAPVVSSGGVWRLGALGEALSAGAAGAAAPEHVVVMRRLPDGSDARSRLAAGRLAMKHADAAARRLAEFHAEHGLGSPAPFEASEWLARIEAPMIDMIEVVGESGCPEAGSARIEALEKQAHTRLHALRADFERRRREGRAVDAHGDLHLDHLWFERDDDDPIFIDCIEFSEDLRRIDAASEVAFLSMDLRYRGHPALAERFLRVYAEASDDFHLYRVADWYESYRAAVRGGVAALASADEAIASAQRSAAARSARDHLALAEAALADVGPGPLLLVCGVIGTGKSTLARALADRVGGAVVSSDVVRKHLAGLSPTDRGGSFDELYSAEAKARVHRALLERAADIVASGRAAILDATWSQRGQRDAAIQWAAERGVKARVVEVRASEDEIRARLLRRSRAGSDASDAGPELLEQSRREFEPVAGDSTPEYRVVWTDRPGWEAAIDAVAREFGSIGRPRPAPR